MNVILNLKAVSERATVFVNARVWTRIRNDMCDFSAEEKLRRNFPTFGDGGARYGRLQRTKIFFISFVHRDFSFWFRFRVGSDISLAKKKLGFVSVMYGCYV